jgi:hypothetical protein
MAVVKGWVIFAVSWVLLVGFAISLWLMCKRRRAQAPVLPIHNASAISERSGVDPVHSPVVAEAQLKDVSVATLYAERPSNAHWALKLTVACLMCFSAPKDGAYDFCGAGCKDIAMKYTPVLLAIPAGHVTFTIGAYSK